MIRCDRGRPGVAPPSELTPRRPRSMLRHGSQIAGPSDRPASRKGGRPHVRSHYGRRRICVAPPEDRPLVTRAIARELETVLRDGRSMSGARRRSIRRPIPAYPENEFACREPSACAATTAAPSPFAASIAGSTSRSLRPAPLIATTARPASGHVTSTTIRATARPTASPRWSRSRSPFAVTANGS